MALKSTIDLTCNDYISNFEFDVFTRFTNRRYGCCSYIINTLLADCSNPGRRCWETGKFLQSPTPAMWLSLPMMRCPPQPYSSLPPLFLISWLISFRWKLGCIGTSTSLGVMSFASPVPGAPYYYYKRKYQQAGASSIRSLFHLFCNIWYFQTWSVGHRLCDRGWKHPANNSPGTPANIYINHWNPIQSKFYPRLSFSHFDFFHCCRTSPCAKPC